MKKIEMGCLIFTGAAIAILIWTGIALYQTLNIKITF
jgi:hypothetical protein